MDERGLKILIVDDEPNIRTGLSKGLRREAELVEEAADGEEGLEVALSERPDLIFLDVMMPKLSGYEVCREIKAVDDQIHIVLLTAKGQESDRAKGLECGADEYMTKPFSPSQVIQRLAEIFESLGN